MFHVRADMSSPFFMVLCGALCLLIGDNPAWVYTDIKYSPLVNVDGVEAYSKAAKGRLPPSNRDASLASRHKDRPSTSASNPMSQHWE